jgi:hypothetical protein
MRSKLRLLAIGAATTMLSLASVASADTLDLTTVNASGTFNLGVDFFQQVGPQPTGSGVIDSFVRISAANEGLVQGYNTDARTNNNKGQFDEDSTATFNHSLLLADVPIVKLGNVNYRQFLLDINQTGASPQLTLNELQIFVGNTGSPFNANVDGVTGNLDFPNLVYDMDLLSENSIQLDFSLNSGSGSGDMFAYIADSKFTGGSFVTLYSKFGDPSLNNDGYEEWAVLKGATAVVPLPLAAWGGMALCGFVGASKLRRRQQVD